MNDERKPGYAEIVAANLGPAAMSEQQQARLRALSVSFLSAGGMNGHIAILLARMGVGRIRFWDDNRFAASDINRMAGAAPETLGQPRASVVAAEVERVNPHVRTETVDRDFFPGDGPELVRGADVLVDG